MNDEGFNLVKKIETVISIQNNINFDIAELLTKLKEDKKFQELGYDNWLDFINSDHISLKKSTVYNYIRAYKVYIEKLEFDKTELSGIAFDKLVYILPKVAKLDRELVTEWIEKARTLSRSDLLIELSEDKPKEKKELKTKLVKVFKCDKCNKWSVDMNKEDICECT
jgi:hypothetical protein